MKKVFRLAALVVTVAMIAAMAIVPASAEAVKTQIITVDGVAFMEIGFYEDAGRLEFKTPAGGVGGANEVQTWALDALKLTAKTGGITGTGNAPGSVETAKDQYEFEQTGAGSVNAADGYAGGCAFPNAIPAGTTILTLRVDGDAGGTLTLQGDFGGEKKNGDQVIETFTLTFTNEEEEPEPTTEEPEPTTEPTPTEAPPESTQPETTTTRRPGGVPGANNNWPATSAPATTGTAPRGGVALAIIPTILAAGAAVVASKKRK